MRSSPAPAAWLARLCDPGALRIAILLAGILLLALAWTRNVNWDEFFFLSHVHASLEGRLTRPFQTAYVHAFGWLARVPGHEMEQIFAARLVMTALFAGTALSIHRISAALAGPGAAAIAVVAFLASGFALAHGTSFRADPIAAACLMGALAIAMTMPMRGWQVAAMAVLCAAALLATAKAVLYLPAFLGALAWRAGERRALALILLAGGLGLALAAALYVLHASGIESAPGLGTAQSGGNAVRTTLLRSGLVPRANAAALWTLLSIGSAVLALAGLLAPGTVRARLVRVSFVLPMVLSVLVYRNAYPYFFPFIAPPVMVVAAIGAARLGRGPVLGGLVATMLLSGAWQGAVALRENSALQRATLAEVHRLFPEPVSYIDRNAMVATFPRDLFFMSSWGLGRYRNEGRPVMADLLERTAPPLLLANHPGLKRAVENGPPQPRRDLLPEDAAVLHGAYVRYAGPIWLAGRDLTLGEAAQSVSLPIRGSYRIDSAEPVNVDGRVLPGGAVIEVDGAFEISGTPGSEVRLVWDAPGGVEDPPPDLPDGPLYAGFWYL